MLASFVTRCVSLKLFSSFLGWKTTKNKSIFTAVVYVSAYYMYVFHVTRHLSKGVFVYHAVKLFDQRALNTIVIASRLCANWMNTFSWNVLQVWQKPESCTLVVPDVLLQVVQFWAVIIVPRTEYLWITVQYKYVYSVRVFFDFDCDMTSSALFLKTA